jgi:two-component system, NarL family, invasion response regulator UvrY
MKILIVDDHTVVREGLKQILSRLPDCSEVGEAGDGAQALRQVREREWDLVLLDVALPGGNGLDALKRIKEERPRLPVLILSMFPEDQYALRVLRAGANGYLTKESAPDQLLSAVREAVAGRKYISPAVGAQLALSIDTTRGESPHEALSDRELEILLAIARGATVGEIAQELHLSVKTVSSYRTRVLEKLQLKNNAQLMLYAMRRGLVE